MKNILCLIFIIFLLAACSGGGNDPVVDPNAGGTPTGGGTPPVVDDSTLSSALSHPDDPSIPGTNCMQGSCHDGKKSAQFVTAGSIFTALKGGVPYTNGATVEIYSDEGRTDLIQAIEVDQLGNFYSSTPLDFKSYVDSADPTNIGVFITLVTEDGGSIQKVSRAPHGECNVCHDHGNEFTIYAPPPP